MRTNKLPPAPQTHEGGTGGRQTPLVELERRVATCLLWEDTFYEKGSSIANEIADLCTKVRGTDIAALALKARNDLKLRHIPLWLCVQLLKHKDRHLAALTIYNVCQRPDELAELLTLYWKEGRTPISAQLRKGLAAAFPKFSSYQLAKWNRPGTIRLRDALFLSHAKPKDASQDETWKQLISNKLAPPDTWEVALSTGKDKRATWERLLREDKLGDMALLMNLRNMEEAGVGMDLISMALLAKAEGSKALPFRYVSAAKAVPNLATAISDAMVKAVSGSLAGDTTLVIDVSGSMDDPISAKSQLTRWEAAAALAILIREVCPRCTVFTFSDKLVQVPNYRGLPLLDAIGRSQSHRSTYLGSSLAVLKRWMESGDNRTPQRLIVITDEQAHDDLPQAWIPRSYIVNVAPYHPGLNTHSGWCRISGWSERLVDWIRMEESNEVQ